MGILPHQAEIEGKISYRHFACVLCSIGLGIVYGLRVNFHVAIVSMVNHTALGLPHDEAEFAKEDGPFVWSKFVQGLLLSCFFMGYQVALLPGGRIAEIFSAKWVMFFAVATNAIGALLSPLAANIHYIALLIMRIVQGIGGGVTFPCTHVFLAHWAPPSERSLMSSIAYAGTALGTVFYMLSAGMIAAKISWDWIFYLHGGISAIWLPFWAFFVADSPTQQKFIRDEERDYIMDALNPAGNPQQGVLKMPWKKAIFSKAFMAILVAHTCSNWGFYMILVELPLYMKTILKFKMEDNSFLTALPFLTMWFFSMVFGKLLDYLRAKKIINTAVARKIATAVASVIPLICLLILCYVKGQVLAVILMTITVTAIGAMFSGFLSNHIDISPKFAGTLMALTNTIATIPGIAVPFVVSALTERDPSINSWRIIFWFTAALYVLEVVVFSIFGEGEEQEWSKEASNAQQNT